MKNKILILGSNGGLGQELFRVFSISYNVTAWSRKELDITNKREVNKKIVQLNPDIIINATAYNAVDRCEENKKEFDLAKIINGYGVGYLAEVACKIGAIFIHYSTDYVFDGKKKPGHKEDDKPNPINNYGYSKLLGEELIQSFAKDGNFQYYIIRTSKLFGKPGKSKRAKKSFFDVMLEISENKKELRIVNEELSLFTYTFDLAEKTLNLINQNREYGIYHMANSEPCTWYDAAEFLFKISGKDINLIPISSDEFARPAKRTRYSILLNTKISPLRSWKNALMDYIDV